MPRRRSLFLRPLAGVRVAVTREADKISRLADLLKRRGAVTLSCPAIEAEMIARSPGLARVLGRLAGYDWVVFTSATGVAAFFGILRRRGLDASAIACAFANARFAVIGPGTAEALKRYGRRRANIVPRKYIAESLSRAIGSVKGLRVLIPRAEVARDVLPKRLSARGAKVTVLNTYRTRPCLAGLRRLRRAISADSIGAVTFTSSSTVTFSMRALGKAGREKLASGRVVAASIGPITSATLKRWGITPLVEAREYSLDGLVAGLVRYYIEQRRI